MGLNMGRVVNQETIHQPNDEGEDDARNAEGSAVGGSGGCASVPSVGSRMRAGFRPGQGPAGRKAEGRGQRAAGQEEGRGQRATGQEGGEEGGNRAPEEGKRKRARAEEEGGGRQGGPEEDGAGRQGGPGEEGRRPPEGCRQPPEEDGRAAEEGRRPRAAEPEEEVDVRRVRE